MTLRYLPHSAEEIREMLERIGERDIDNLFDSIPSDVKLKDGLELEPALDEPSLMRHLSELAAANAGAGRLSFIGGGMYAHHVPPAVDQLLLRSEYYTAYTPYQAELSQGTLQAIFEFQTVVCELFGAEVANASMYDGASATAEAVLMARRIRKKPHVVLSAGLHPEYIETVKAYVRGMDGTPKLSVAPLDSTGRTDWAAAKSLFTDDTAALVVGYPNFLGCVEDLRAARALADEHDALLVTATAEPYALSVVEAPGVCGADVCVGEGQPLAVPPQFGGPGVGLFACSQKFVRQMPGRLVGETVDEAGERGYVLTLSTREQHIRRERATSNICTNHGLIALAFGIRAAMLGRSGFERVGQTCLAQAEYLKASISAIAGCSLPYSAPTFNEFVVRFGSKSADEIVTALAEQGISAGLDLGRFDAAWGHDLLVSTTELHRRADLDRFVSALEALA